VSLKGLSVASLVPSAAILRGRTFKTQDLVEGNWVIINATLEEINIIFMRPL
jgi:hypothetical protein